MTLRELKLQAKVLKIRGYSRMTKAQLEEAINLTLEDIERSNRPVEPSLERISVIGLDPERAATVLKELPKGIRRKVRKEAFRAGYRGLAAIR